MVYFKSVLAGIAGLILSIIVLGIGVVIKVRESLPPLPTFSDDSVNPELLQNGGGYFQSGPWVPIHFSPLWTILGTALMLSAFTLGFFLEFRRASRRRAIRHPVGPESEPVRSRVLWPPAKPVPGGTLTGKSSGTVPSST